MFFESILSYHAENKMPVKKAKKDLKSHKGTSIDCNKVNYHERGGRVG